MKNLYKKAEQFVADSLAKTGNENDIIHAKRTVHWIKELKLDADQSLLIAGVAHDIERAFFGDWKKGSMDPEELKKHQDLSASEVEKFLRREKADEKIIERVKMLVAHHEEGGDEDQNILCDADCLAYFEDKALRFAKKAKEKGKEKEMKEKLEHVFSRITSPKAKQIAQKWYKHALEELDFD